MLISRGPRLLFVTLAAIFVGLTFTACDPITLSVTPKTYKFTKAGKASFVIDVTGIGEVFIDDVKLSSETNFKFPGGVSHCEGERVGTKVGTCTETVELPTYKSGLSAKLEVTVKNLHETAQLTS
jgi:hypothetical protein